MGCARSLTATGPDTADTTSATISVDRGLDRRVDPLGRQAADRQRHGRALGQAFDRGGQAFVGQNARVDAVGDRAELIDPEPELAARFVDERDGLLAHPNSLARQDAEPDRDRDEVLLRTVVQVALEALALLGGRGDDALASGGQIGQLCPCLGL